MTMQGSAFCSICLLPFRNGERWFLLSEDRWTDQLRIFRWDEKLAQRAEIHAACSLAHVQQLVVHWMTTGDLDYPFASTEDTHEEPNSSKIQLLKSLERLDVGRAEILGELSVDRNSMSRVLRENPESLGSLLLALPQALNGQDTENSAWNEACEEDGVHAFMDA